MTESLLINLIIILLFMPLLGFVVTLFLSKRIKSIYLFENFIIVAGLLLSIVIMVVKLTWYVSKDWVSEFTWIDFGVLPLLGKVSIELGITMDNITVIMMFVVYLISALVHIYSIAYMKGDQRYNRYFAYLGIFTFSMAGIVLAHNLLMMYIFWELVGLSSYLLIGFWYEKKSASDAGKKAFLVNRVGDIGMFLGILILFTHYKTFTLESIFAQINAGNLPFGSEAMLTLAGILVFCGAVGKSAQFPLHVWLPDAMEGPTPVSALIHAATMVAAGVYLVVRIFVMLTGDALFIIASIGAITAFVAATIALTQNDIKKVLAYSTVSQLGYMILALGVGAYAFAFFHLITHAFFKACLFLGSGSVIHAMHHEQDITKMGGLRKKMPLTYYTFLISTLAISGVPLTSGFLSKDGILAGTMAFGSLTGNYIFAVAGFIVALMTAFYMFRLVILTFHGKPQNEEKYNHAHESPFVMVLPLVILATLSIFFFYTPNPINADSGWFVTSWVTTPATVTPENTRFDFMKGNESVINSEIVHSTTYVDAFHKAHYPAMALSLLVAGLGILLAFGMYQWKKINADKLADSIKPLYNFSLNKWYIDELYNYTFISLAIGLSKFLAWFDLKIIDGIVDGSAELTKKASNFSGKFDTYVVDGLVNFTAYFSGFVGLILRKFQTGKVQTYIVMVIFSLVILLFIFR